MSKSLSRDERLRRGSPFTNTTGIIKALGGPGAVAKLTGSEASAVANWQKFDHFPSRFYVVMLDALHERGLQAPARLWGMAAKGQKRIKRVKRLQLPARTNGNKAAKSEVA
jgi:hypothetical protein